MEDFNIEQLNKFNISVSESMKIIENLQDDQKAKLAKSALLEALRRMSEYFVEKFKPVTSEE
jgi:hypothetical protein